MAASRIHFVPALNGIPEHNGHKLPELRKAVCGFTFPVDGKDTTTPELATCSKCKRKIKQADDWAYYHWSEWANDARWASDLVTWRMCTVRAEKVLAARVERDAKVLAIDRERLAKMRETLAANPPFEART